MISATTQLASDAALTAPKQDARPHLAGPVIDFLLLGGGSLLVLGCLALTRPGPTIFVPLAAMSLVLAHFINHPHFAASYQIFYRDFGDKAFGTHGDRQLRARYVFAGIVIPALLMGFFTLTLFTADPRRMAWAASLMLLLVGWHYVKQGYGIFIVGSVLQRRFLDKREKGVFLANAYACWTTYWLAANWMVSERNLWGLRHYMLKIPDAVLIAAISFAACTSVMAAFTVYRRLRQGKGISTNGAVAYFTTVYIWLFLLLNPLYALLIPAFHSLQYLAVVWRFQSNRETALNSADSLSNAARQLPFAGSPRMRLAIFWLTSMILGYLGFWALPEFLNSFEFKVGKAFGPELFLFIFWTFINIHHYFLDNVMWRKENKETARYLFR